MYPSSNICKRHICINMCLVTQSCPTLCNPMDCIPPGSSVHGDSLGKNAGVVCHALLQGIFPTQRSNPGLPHCRWILYQLSNQGSPHIHTYLHTFASLVAQLCKESSCNAGDPGSISGSGGSSGEGISSVQFSHSVVSDSLRPHESQHARPPCPSPTPQVHSDSHPSSR